MTNWSYELHSITGVIDYTFASCRIKFLPKMYDGALFRKTELTTEENEDGKKVRIIINQIIFVPHF